MRRLLALAAVLAAAGCSAGSDEPPQRTTHPSWLSQTYDDGKVLVRYPDGWIRNRTERFGRVLSDNTSTSPAFVGIRYLPQRDWTNAKEFAEVARRTLRPPDGTLTTLLYTQTARVGGRRGYEAGIIWRLAADARGGPRMRIFGIDLPSGEVALLTFAAEDYTRHALRLGWIKREIAWR